jgi:hypothetical protein
MGFLSFLVPFLVDTKEISIMAHRQETTYAAQMTHVECRLSAIQQQIFLEQDLIARAKQPGTLLSALMSARVRQDALQQVYNSRGRLAQLERDLSYARAEIEELKRLAARYPEHDRLMEQAEQLRFQSWRLSLQEDELDLGEREVRVAERLEEHRLQQEQEELIRQHEEIARQQAALDKRRNALKKKRGACAP